jgi:hypothetical protein
MTHSLQNKTISDTNTDTILSLQGVGWLKRKAIIYGTVTLAVKHYKDDAGVEHIDIDQTLTGGIPGTTETRTLSWTERHNEDHIFGAVVGKTRRIKAEELEDDFLKKNWTADTFEHGVVQSYVESDTPKSGTTWIANQVGAPLFYFIRPLTELDQAWGIEDVDGERRYSRHIKFTGPGGEDIECKLVYDYREWIFPRYFPYN